MVYRQPFSGPGLGVRCLGAITRDRLEALREADAILRDEFDKCGLAEKVWQYFIAVPDLKSVGVRDESRYEGWPAIIRAVNTKDAMTATIEEIPYAQFRFTNWKGEADRKTKRGFATKKEALEWERGFLTQSAGNLEMTFEAFYEWYKKNLQDRLK